MRVVERIPRLLRRRAAPFRAALSPAGSGGTEYGEFAAWIVTLPRPPASRATAVALPLARTASPGRSACSGAAGRHSAAPADRTSTAPLPGLSSVITPAMSGDSARESDAAINKTKTANQHGRM